MKQDDSLIKEAERQRKLLRDAGLNEHLKLTRDPGYSQLIEEASMRPRLATDNIARDSYARMAAALERPLNDAIRNMQEHLHRGYLSQLERIQQDLAQHLALTARIPELNNFKNLQETLIREQALHIEKMFQPAQLNAMVDAARQFSESSRLRELQAFQLRNADALHDHVVNSMLAVVGVSRFVNLNANLASFPESFAAEMLAHLPKHDIADVSELDEAELEELHKEQLAFISFLIEKLRELDPAWVNFIGILSLLWGFASFTWQEYSSNQTEERVLAAVSSTKTERSERMREQEALIAKELARLVPETKAPTLYVVERTARLKLSVKPGSSTVAVLPPNQTVELLAGRGKWIYVEFFDYLEGIPKQGWVLKKYLKRVPAFRKD